MKFMRSLIHNDNIISLCKVFGVPPVLNYAGQVAVNGYAFEGNGLSSLIRLLLKAPSPIGVR